MKACENEKKHEQILSLKRIRLHHKVLAKVSYNAYKFIIECSEVLVVYKDQVLFKQGSYIDYVYFVLYGGLMVTLANSNLQKIGDVVRGGNVLGEEAFFSQNPAYKESAVCHTEEVGLLQVNSALLSELGMDNFQGKGNNQLAYQRDFKALFSLLRQIHLTKEEWRGRAMAYMTAQQVSSKNKGNEFTEYRNKKK